MERKAPLTCAKCRLYNKKEGVCTVVVMHAGQQLELKTKPTDECAWEKEGIEVQRLRMWSDAKDGHLEWTENDEPAEDIEEKEVPVWGLDGEGKISQIGVAKKRE